MATLAELEALKNQALADIARTQQQIVATQNAIKLAEKNLAAATDPVEQSRYRSSVATLNQLLNGYTVQLQGYQSQLAQINGQIQSLQAQPAAKQSVGDTTRQSQQANADGADVQAPNIGPQVLNAEGRVTPALASTVPSNAARPTTTEDSGVDATTRSARTLQSTPPITSSSPPPPNAQGPYPSQTIGAAAGNDDTPRANNVRSTIETIFGSTTNKFIDPRPNVLDNYANYTYNISLYILGQEQFANMLQAKNKSVAGFQLLMRSGGIPVAGGTVQNNNQVIANVEDAALGANAGNATGPSQSQLGRSQFFPLDFTIDDVRIEMLAQGRGTGAAHNVTTMSFKIIEPNGLSLYDNLFRAAQQINQLDGSVGNVPQNYAAQNYLMVIRFYGYDANGNLAKPTPQDQLVPGTDPNAIVEKFIPFQFTGINFRIANRLTEYDCTAVCPQFNIGYSQGRGTIPYNVEISSQTLRELFVGNLNFVTPTQSGNTQTDGRQGQQADVRRVDNAIAAGQSSTTVTAGSSTGTPAPPKANAAANPTITSGLAAALNRFEKDLVEKEKRFLYPDTYEIIFPQGAEIIADAKVIPPGDLNKQAVSFNSKAGATAADLKDPTKSTPNTNSKPSNAPAGMSIMQFLDQYIRTSTYIYDQQTKYLDPVTRTIVPNGSPTGISAWYNISVEARPKQYDPKRNDFAYHIIYRITPFKVNDLRSDWFPLSQYQGVQKRYNYWFTGQNTQVLSYEQDFNYLYYVVVSGQQELPNQGLTASYREYIKRISQPNSNQSSQGIPNSDVNEPSANAADNLYSPADQVTVKMKILGDPSWIQQGELWSGVSGLQMNYDPFLPDGTINYAAQEAMFEVAFNKPVDYNLETGILDPGQKNFGANRPDGIPGQATQSYVYRMRQCISYFSRGRFEQELDGTIVLFPIGSDTNLEQKNRVIANVEDAALGASAGRTGLITNANQGTADTARLVRTLGANNSQLPPAPNAAQQPVASSLPRNAPSDDAATATTLPASPAQPPTSGSQVVGPAAVVSSGTAATGTAVGTPSVSVSTRTGALVTVTNQGELTTLYNSGQISVTTYNTASATLSARQQQANNPVTNTPAQQLKKDNG